MKINNRGKKLVIYFLRLRFDKRGLIIAIFIYDVMIDDMIAGMIDVSYNTEIDDSSVSLN